MVETEKRLINGTDTDVFLGLISDPPRGCYMVLHAFFFFFFFFPPRFCTDHISGTVTLRDSKLSVLLGPAV